MNNTLRACLLAIASSCAGLLSASAQHRPLELSDFRPQNGLWHEAKVASLNPAQRKRLNVGPGTGLITNGEGQTTNLLTAAEFGDLEVHVEYLIPEDSNSGVYLMGRYEVQIRDSFGVTPARSSDAGGIYQRWDPKRTPKGWAGVPPRVNASRPPGEWQTLDIIFRAPRFDAAHRKTENARFVQVVHNGVVVHQDVPVTGPTQSATYEDEQPTGPIMFQGDHGPIAYRNLKVRRLDLRPTPDMATDWEPLDLKNDFDLLLGDEVPGAKVDDVLEVSGNEIRAMYRWPAHAVAPSGLVVSKQRYSHFDLEYEITSGPRGFEPPPGEKNRNAGFLYHIQGTDQIWPSCLEVQGMKGHLGDLFSIRGVNCHQLTAEGRLVEVPRHEYAHGPRRLGTDREGFNFVRVEVRGDAASYYVNGQLVNVIQQAAFGGVPCTAGFIGFQAEQAEVTYRNLRIRFVASGKAVSGSPAIGPVKQDGPDFPPVRRVVRPPGAAFKHTL